MQHRTTKNTAVWIQHQFETADQFPQREASDQLHAYKAWTHTPVTDKAVSQWVKEWMSAEEIIELNKHLKM